MITLDQAVKIRYSALGLASSVGQIYDEQEPERSTLPYVSYENQSDTRYKGTQTSVYQRAMVTFTVWHTQKLLCGQLCELIEAAFKNCNKAASNPLVIGQAGNPVSFILSSPYILKQISDTIWSGAQTYTVTYRKNADIRPAV